MGGFVKRVLLVASGCLFWRLWKMHARRKETRKAYFEWTDDRRFEWFINRRTGYSDGARESYSRYDQTIAGVSAGTIVLSITFLKDIGYTQWSIPFLYAAWIAFLIAAGCSLFSLRTSGDFDLEQIKQLENLCMGRDQHFERVKALGAQTGKLNTIALRAFVTGIFLAMIFAFVNYPVLGGKRWAAEKEAQLKAAPQRVEVVLVAPAPKQEGPPRPLPAPPSATRPSPPEAEAAPLESSSPTGIQGNRSPRP